MIEINDQFLQALELMEKTLEHVFITGKAGTGKSTLLSFFIEKTKKQIAVLAPTGVAALNVNGETIHSFFKFLPNTTPEVAAKKGKQQRKSKLYENLKTIIIDEVSMVRADLMDCVDVFLRAARGKKKPFGEVQMILIGDLYQLPPVVTTHERPHFETFYKSPWFFDSQAFKNKDFAMEFVELEKIYRQKDADFIELLNAIRTNTVDTSHILAINRRLSAAESKDAINLTSTNDRANEINQFRLSQLKSKLHSFKGFTDGSFDSKHLPTDQLLNLKTGAQVMFANNDAAGRWVNGTIGHVTKLVDGIIYVKISNGAEVEVSPHTWDLYKYYYDKSSRSLDQKTVGSFTQIPLRLAWAITIHKSQGKTFDKVKIDLGRGSFASGQTYVALSRCRTFMGISLENPIKPSDIRLDWRVQKFLTSFQYAISEKALPLEQKVKIIQDAVDRELELEILYLKAKDIKSRRIIKPRGVGQFDYNGKLFLGMEAWCCLRKRERVFRVDRILEIRKVG
ncbi:MAG: AAA family ATPase [Patescibacteria group bacterium]